jgi:hypothetical protein
MSRGGWGARVACIVVGSTCALLGAGFAPSSASPSHPIATLGMPFTGQWVSNVLESPPYTNDPSYPAVNPANNFGDWATNVYGAEGTPIILHVTSGDGPVTFRWVASTASCDHNSSKIEVYVNGVDVGWIFFAHFQGGRGSNVSDPQPTNGMVIGTMHYFPSGDCNPGPHLHVELSDNHSGAYKNSCWTDWGRPGVTLQEGDSLGILGSLNQATKQACTDPNGGTGSGGATTTTTTSPSTTTTTATTTTSSPSSTTTTTTSTTTTTTPTTTTTTTTIPTTTTTTPTTTTTTGGGGGTGPGAGFQAVSGSGSTTLYCPAGVSLGQAGSVGHKAGGKNGGAGGAGGKAGCGSNGGAGRNGGNGANRAVGGAGGAGGNGACPPERYSNGVWLTADGTQNAPAPPCDGTGANGGSGGAGGQAQGNSAGGAGGAGGNALFARGGSGGNGAGGGNAGSAANTPGGKGGNGGNGGVAPAATGGAGGKGGSGGTATGAYGGNGGRGGDGGTTSPGTAGAPGGNGTTTPGVDGANGTNGP